MKTIIYNGRIICGDTIIPKGYVGVENGVITEIGSSGKTKKTESAQWIDAEGNYVSPGFIDLHVHGVGLCDLYKNTVLGLEHMAKILASQGVTSFLPTLITAPLDKIIDTISIIKVHLDIPGAHILGVNLEGPYINPEKKGAHPIKDIRKPNVNELKNIIDAGGGIVKIITVAPELPGAFEYIDLLKENSIIPAIGHTLASFEETMNAIDKGFTYISHTFNAMTPFHHRAPGAIGAILMRKEVVTEIIADGVHVHPAVVKLLCRLKDKEKIILVTDALVGIMRKGDKAEFAGVEVTHNGFGTYDSRGTLMGSIVSMNKAVQNVTRFTDLDLTSAIKLATINPASLLGIADHKGMIEIGKDADIVILGDDLSVKTTLVKGKVM